MEMYTGTWMYIRIRQIQHKYIHVCPSKWAKPTEMSVIDFLVAEIAALLIGLFVNRWESEILSLHNFCRKEKL